MNMRIILLVLLALTISNCGKKGGIEYPGGQEIPSFDKVFDE